MLINQLDDDEKNAMIKIINFNQASHQPINEMNRQLL